MQVQACLRVSKKELSAFLQEMVQRDVEASTNNRVEKITSGFTYKKHIPNYMQKQESVHVCIDILKDGLYQATFESAQGKNSLSYAYEEIEDGGLLVTYEEDYYGTNTSTQLSHKFMAFMTNRKNKKRAETLLQQIEKMIVEQRDKEKA